MAIRPETAIVSHACPELGDWEVPIVVDGLNSSGEILCNTCQQWLAWGPDGRELIPTQPPLELPGPPEPLFQRVESILSAIFGVALFCGVMTLIRWNNQNL